MRCALIPSTTVADSRRRQFDLDQGRAGMLLRCFQLAICGNPRIAGARFAISSTPAMTDPSTLPRPEPRPGLEHEYAALGERLRDLLPCVERSEEHTSELQSLMRISYAVFCLKKKKHTTTPTKQSYETYQDQRFTAQK